MRHAIALKPLRRLTRNWGFETNRFVVLFGKRYKMIKKLAKNSETKKQSRIILEIKLYKVK